MTKAERTHYNQLTQLGCIVCIRLGYGYSQPEIHHPRSGQGMGQRAHYKKAIPLCPPHHRTGGHGVALHAGQKTFEAKYGTEAELLTATEELMKEAA